MCVAMDTDANEESGYRVIEKMWGDMFEKEARKIVDKEYDFNKIKGNKTLEEFYYWMVQLEIRKAMVYAHRGFAESMVEQARKNVDEMTQKLGMAYSTLGCLYHHPEEKPQESSKKKKQKTQAAPSRAVVAKVNMPRRLRDGIEALPKTDKSFLEALLDSDGSFKTAVEELKKSGDHPNPQQAQKIAELEGEVAKIRQEVYAKDRCILELETNGCALISLMLSHKLNILPRYIQASF